ncbi:hypothetical protein M422DRAFT_779323 [Sphaerobolus stellatus SS14]|uniref:Uncharacterized protein n=1 Tax=Sphaerobolus stellatus (strain SS14) TaxID=990650 RepID=A0A0C9W002_SPHS4|nr:hypothetical protein M422DRAFT_779323 [Sphaerobolus stellatus SS14]
MDPDGRGHREKAANTRRVLVLGNNEAKPIKLIDRSGASITYLASSTDMATRKAGGLYGGIQFSSGAIVPPTISESHAPASNVVAVPPQDVPATAQEIAAVQPEEIKEVTDAGGKASAGIPPI